MRDHGRIPGIAQYRQAFDPGEIAAQVGFHRQQRELVDLQQGDAPGPLAGALPAQFGTDRAARPRDQHRTCAQPAADRLPIRVQRLPAKQVLDRHFLELPRQGTPVQHVGKARHGTERDATLLADTDHLAHRSRIQRRHRDDQQLRTGFTRDPADIADPAEDRQALQAGSAQGCRIIEETDRLVAADAAQIAHQSLAGLTGTEDQHALGGVVRAQQALILPRAEDQARCPQQHGQHDGIQQQGRARDQIQPTVEEQAGNHRQQPEHAGLEDVQQVGDAGEAPQAAIQTDPPRHQALRHHHDQYRAGEWLQRQRRGLQGIADVVQALPADPDHREVVQHHRQSRQAVLEAITPARHAPNPSVLSFW